MSDLKLYHYSKDKYDELKTKELTTPMSREERQRAIERAKFTRYPGPYYQHISFFFEPVPLDIIGKIFNNEHPFWYPGNEIFEYEVDISKLSSFSYHIVESKICLDEFYSLDYGDDDDFDAVKYYRVLDELQRKAHERGHGVTDFLKGRKAQLGQTRKMYEKLPKRPNWNEIRDKYAATVPHVMIYPIGGLIRIDKTTPVKVK